MGLWSWTNSRVPSSMGPLRRRMGYLLLATKKPMQAMESWKWMASESWSR